MHVSVVLLSDSLALIRHPDPHTISLARLSNLQTHRLLCKYYVN